MWDTSNISFVVGREAPDEEPKELGVKSLASGENLNPAALVEFIRAKFTLWV
jgi:hypothetical protein